MVRCTSKRKYSEFSSSRPTTNGPQQAFQTRMAARSGSVGRSGHVVEANRKPPIPTFSKPRAKSDASKDAVKKENATDASKHAEKDKAHEKSDKTSSDSGSDNGNQALANHIKGESEAEMRRMNSHASTVSTKERPKSSGDADKPDTARKTGVKTMVIPSRYMSTTTGKASPRIPTPAPTLSKPPAKTNTTTTTNAGLRSKTPERTVTRAKTPTKQPTTPRINATTTTTHRTITATQPPKRVTPTPTTPTRGTGRKTPVPTSVTTKANTRENRHLNPGPLSPKSAAVHKEDILQNFNIKIAGLQAQIKQLALERDSVLFQQNAEGSEASDWDESLSASASVDGASETSSEIGDEIIRDEKYVEIVRRYRSTLSVLSNKIVILKTALTDARGEYDTLQHQHKQLLVAHQQSLSDLDKIKASDVASI